MCALITLILHCAQVPRVEHHVTLRWIVTRPAHFPLPLVVYASHPVASSLVAATTDTRQPESSSAKDVVRLEVVDERMEDIRKWTAGGVSAREVFKLLEMDHDGLVLCKVGRKRYIASDRRVCDALTSLRFASNTRHEAGITHPQAECSMCVCLCA